MKRLELWGRNLRGAREGVGFTQAELAERIGVQQSSVARWEAGVAAPSDERKIALARLLNQEAYDLFPLVEDD